MLWYSVPLTLIALAAIVLLAGLSLAVTPLLRRRINEQFLLGARNQAFKQVLKQAANTPAERATATGRYLTLLKSGGNDHPMEQLKKAGYGSPLALTPPSDRSTGRMAHANLALLQG